MVLLLIVFFGLLFIGVPIPATLGLALFQNTVTGGDVSLVFIARTMVGSMNSFPILAVPMFILAGEIMGRGGISKRLFDFSNSLVGGITGGVPMATVLTCMLFGSISGSGPATFAAVGTLMIPMMVKQGYDLKFVTGITAAAGSFGVILPPSIPMVMYAVSANVSIGSMFMAGIIPGIIFGVFLMGYAYIYCKFNTIPPVPPELAPMPVLKSFKEGFFALLAPVIILGGIYSGVFTATEAAAVAVVYGILISRFIYKSIVLKDLPKYIYNAAATNGPILLIVALATVFGRVLTFEGIPRQIADGIMGISTNPIIILLIINLVLLIIGLFMEPLSSIIILTPILLPIALSIGVDPIHFGIIMIANLAISLVTPPLGISLFVAASITKLPILALSRAAIGPIIALLIALLIIVFVPELSTFLAGGL